MATRISLTICIVYLRFYFHLEVTIFNNLKISLLKMDILLIFLLYNIYRVNIAEPHIFQSFQLMVKKVIQNIAALDENTVFYK